MSNSQNNDAFGIFENSPIGDIIKQFPWEGIKVFAAPTKPKKKYNAPPYCCFAPETIRGVLEQYADGQSLEFIAGCYGLTIDDVDYIIDGVNC